jgi:hypothetical protein
MGCMGIREILLPVLQLVMVIRCKCYYFGFPSDISKGKIQQKIGDK